VIWVVRDFDQGQAMPYVSVWSTRPKKHAFGTGSRVWLSERGDLHGWLGSLWIQDAAKLLGTVPDDDVQVIVMDREPARVRQAIDRINGTSFKVPKP
jgi:hypothetical protein